MSPIARLAGAAPRLGGARRPAVRRRIARFAWLRGCHQQIAITHHGGDGFA